MKKKTIFSILLSTCLILTGCNDKGNHSSSTQSVSTIPVTFDTSYIYNTLSLIGNIGNYELVYLINEKEYRDVYNSSYVYYEFNQNGGVLIDSYDRDAYPQKILYQYEIKNQQVHVLSALLGDNRQPLTNTTEFDFMPLINDPKFKVTESDIEVGTNGSFYTDDKNLILILATVLGYYEYAIYDLFDRIVFHISKQGAITFTLQMYSTDGNMILTDVDWGRFENIGNAKNSLMENFIKNYQLPKTLITNAQAMPAFGSTISTHSEVTLHYGDDEPKIIATNDVDVNENYLKVSSVDETTKKVSSQVYKSVDGFANICGINAFNQPTILNQNIKWDELNWSKNLFEQNTIRQIDSSTYHYFGLYADALFYSLTYLSIDTVKSIDFKVENNKIVEMNTELSASFDSQSNTLYHYSIKTSFVEPRAIKEPTSLSVNSEENNKIKESFSHLKAYKRFRATAYDFENKNTKKTVMTVVDNVVIFEETMTDSTSLTTAKASYGWVEKEGKVIPFKINSDRTLSIVGACIEGDTLDNHIGFNISSEVFTINDEGRYVTKPNLVEIENHLICGPNKEGLIADTLSMIVNDNGYITRMVYQYSVELANGQMISGTDFVDFDQYGTAKLTNKMNEEIAKLEVPANE